jgi:hypothetical protein
MVENLKKLIVAVPVVVGVLCTASVPARADWATDWKNTLGELWANTKTKTKEVLDPQRYRPKGTVEIGIAYGTEKEKWLQQAVQDFTKTEAGKYIK